MFKNRLSAFQNQWANAQKVNEAGVDYVDLSTNLVTAWQHLVYACSDKDTNEASTTVNAFRDLCESVDTNKTCVDNFNEMSQRQPVICAQKALLFLLSNSFIHKPQLQSALLLNALNFIHYLDDNEQISSHSFVENGLNQLIAKGEHDGAISLLENIPRLLKGSALDQEAKQLLSGIAREFTNNHFPNNLRLKMMYA